MRRWALCRRDNVPLGIVPVGNVPAGHCTGGHCAGGRCAGGTLRRWALCRRDIAPVGIVTDILLVYISSKKRINFKGYQNNIPSWPCLPFSVCLTTLSDHVCLFPCVLHPFLALSAVLGVFNIPDSWPCLPLQVCLRSLPGLVCLPPCV